jgi:bifunctional non-homologous end joining protein LigD
MREVKFDGSRGQLHKHGDEVVVFSRNGKDFAKRFLAIRDSVLSPAAIDGEVVCDNDGKPDFGALMASQCEGVCAWCFDLLELLTQRLDADLGKNLAPLWLWSISDSCESLSH